MYVAALWLYMNQSILQQKDYVMISLKTVTSPCAATIFHRKTITDNLRPLQYSQVKAATNTTPSCSAALDLHHTNTTSDETPIQQSQKW